MKINNILLLLVLFLMEFNIVSVAQELPDINSAYSVNVSFSGNVYTYDLKMLAVPLQPTTVRFKLSDMSGVTDASASNGWVVISQTPTAVEWECLSTQGLPVLCGIGRLTVTSESPPGPVHYYVQYHFTIYDEYRIWGPYAIVGPVPEISTFLLTSLGLFGLVYLKRSMR